MAPFWMDKEPEDEKQPMERPSSSSEKDLKNGLVLAGIGVAGYIAVHSMRPPEGIKGALGMLASGRNHYIKEPTYAILMALCFLAVLVGASLVVRAILNRDH